VSDFILLYSQIFEVDAAELSLEKRMQEVLERYHSANSTTPQNKPSGDLKIWVHLEHKDSTNYVNITVSVKILQKAKVNAAPVPKHHTQSGYEVKAPSGSWN
jgi:hypothetical protein